MFEQLNLEGWTPLSASVVLGLVLGLLFGALAQQSRFCLRRALVGEQSDRASALGTWLIALTAAIGGTAILQAFGLVSLSGHRFLANELPVASIIMGGLLFGAGMVLSRGCASRLTVLTGTGNLRAAIVILVFAATAHATLKGALAPLRTWLGAHTLDLGGIVSLASLPGGSLFWAAAIGFALLAIALRSGTSWRNLTLGALIGTLVPIGWLATGYVLLDEFDPITIESLAFTSSASEALFWWVAGTAINPTFGVGLLGGVLAGSLLTSLLAGEFRWQGFATDAQTGRYLSGGVLMGFGGVLAGGCTVGAGLSGVSTLSFAAILALISIAVGAWSTRVIEMRAQFGRVLPLPAS